MRASHVGAIAFWLVTAGGFSAAVMNAVFFVPEDADQGVIQKIFYLHLPVAINALLACLVVFVGSIGYLLQRKLWWDDLATAGARTAVLFCSVVFYLSAKVVFNILKAGQVSPAMEIPMYWAYAAVPVGILLMGIRFVEAAAIALGKIDGEGQR